MKTSKYFFVLLLVSYTSLNAQVKTNRISVDMFYFTRGYPSFEFERGIQDGKMALSVELEPVVIFISEGLRQNIGLKRYLKSINKSPVWFGIGLSNINESISKKESNRYIGMYINTGLQIVINSVSIAAHISGTRAYQNNILRDSSVDEPSDPFNFIGFGLKVGLLF